MITSTTSARIRTGVAAGLVLAFAAGASACDDDDGAPDPTVVDVLDDNPNVPFDPDVPGGVGTETDERNNQGFESDEPGTVGNQTNPND
jgi:hypothetical protein